MKPLCATLLLALASAPHTCSAARTSSKLHVQHQIRSPGEEQRLPGDAANAGVPTQDALLVQSGIVVPRQQQGALANATVFTQHALHTHLPQLLEEGKQQLGAPRLDVNLARLMARLTSAAYCSDKHVIAAWTCTRCKRVPNFKPYEVGEMGTALL